MKDDLIDLGFQALGLIGKAMVITGCYILFKLAIGN